MICRMLVLAFLGASTFAGAESVPGDARSRLLREMAYYRQITQITE